MWKKALMLALSLGLMTAANLRMYCTVSVCGQELDGLYTRKAVERGRLVSTLAAEEILRDKASPPIPDIRLKPSISKPSRQSGELTDALLRATNGVDVTYGVYVKQQRMGAVEDAAELRAQLNSFITNQLPTWAVSGQISEKLNIVRQYSRAGQTTGTADMVLLITGAAPVFYSDGDGYVNRA